MGAVQDLPRVLQALVLLLRDMLERVMLGCEAGLSGRRREEEG